MRATTMPFDQLRTADLVLVPRQAGPMEEDDHVPQPVSIPDDQAADAHLPAPVLIRRLHHHATFPRHGLNVGCPTRHPLRFEPLLKHHTPQARCTALPRPTARPSPPDAARMPASSKALLVIFPGGPRPSGRDPRALALSLQLLTFLLPMIAGAVGVLLLAAVIVMFDPDMRIGDRPLSPAPAHCAAPVTADTTAGRGWGASSPLPETRGAPTRAPCPAGGPDSPPGRPAGRDYGFVYEREPPTMGRAASSTSRNTHDTQGQLPPLYGPFGPGAHAGWERSTSDVTWVTNCPHPQHHHRIFIAIAHREPTDSAGGHPSVGPPSPHRERTQGIR